MQEKVELKDELARLSLVELRWKGHLLRKLEDPSKRMRGVKAFLDLVVILT